MAWALLLNYLHLTLVGCRRKKFERHVMDMSIVVRSFPPLLHHTVMCCRGGWSLST